MGGFALNTLKKLNGDKFGFPLLSMVLANAIGLGATALCRYPCNFAGAISFGSIVNMAKNFYKYNKILNSKKLISVSKIKVRLKPFIKHLYILLKMNKI
jgi:hypothetical protein